MRTQTQKHTLSGDTIALAATLKRLASRPRPNRLRDWMIEQITVELQWRAQAAQRAI